VSEEHDSGRSDPPRRRGLGRGLDALLGVDTQDYAELDRLRHSKQVPIELLHPNRFQPRRHFDEEQLRSLAESISAQGILQPILVRRHSESANAFEIVAGERRWRAAQLAQLHEVPVVIKDLSDREALEVALVENVQRQDLSPIEEAEGYRRLLDEFGHTQDDLARTLAKSRSHIANTLRLLTLPDAVKAMLASGELSAGHARALVGHADPLSLAEKIVASGLTVRQTEKLASGDKGTERGPRRTREKDPNALAVERDLELALGLRVSLDVRGGGGVLSIHYNNLEQLDDVLTRLSRATGAGDPQR
jgi:ParB family chromosome partitioning protein